MTLGYIAFGNKVYTEKVLSLYYDLTYSLNKQVEVHFTIGESITCIAAGWESLAMKKHLDIADVTTPEIIIEHDVMQNILNKIFNELLPTGKVAVKKATCVWMLCLVKFCSNNEIVKVFCFFYLKILIYMKNKTITFIYYFIYLFRVLYLKFMECFHSC
jgi:proteasome component ECM29